MLDAVRARHDIPTQTCVLTHVTNAIEVMRRGAPVDLVFQSVAGTEAANTDFGVNLGILREAHEAALALRRGTVGDNVMHFETGQGAALSAGAHHGIDQQTVETRAYAVARDFAPLRSIAVQSAATDRATYLRRPDMGRVLDPACHDALAAARSETGEWDIVFVVADGLSPIAAQQHAGAMVRACLVRLPGWLSAPVVIATQARVALGDEIGERIGARFCVMLIGERPGLTVINSLGIYLTYSPRVGRRDSERNCILNIHGHGSSYGASADLLAWLVTEASRLKLTGVALKDDRAAIAPAATPLLG